MSENQEMFVCEIGWGKPGQKLVPGKSVPAETPFPRSAMPEGAFKQLSEQGYIRPAGTPKKGPGVPSLIAFEAPGQPPVEVVQPEAPQAKKEKTASGSKRGDKAQEKAIKKAQADKVWGANPAELQDKPFEVLMSVYMEVCQKYSITPTAFATKEEVIAQLSSQFEKSE
jgi:hypothetical protein